MAEPDPFRCRWGAGDGGWAAAVQDGRDEGLWTALLASLTVGSYETIMGRLLKSTEENADLVATRVRFLPLVATLVMAGVVWVKEWRGSGCWPDRGRR